MKKPCSTMVADTWKPIGGKGKGLHKIPCAVCGKKTPRFVCDDCYLKVARKS